MPEKNKTAEEEIYQKKTSSMVKMSNDVNTQDLFRDVDEFTEVQNNMFYACIAQLYGNSNRIVRFPPEEMKRLMGFNKHVSKKTFIKNINDTLTKFLKIVIKYKTYDKSTGHPILHQGNLFHRSQLDPETFDCVIQVNDEFQILFNQLEQWTRFSLLQYTSLKGNYTKKIYRELKQYRTTGVRNFDLKTFRELFNIPKTYKTSNIRQRVLNRALEELSPFFANLAINDIYEKGKIVGYRFTWIPEDRDKKDFNSQLLDESIAILNIRNNKNMTAKQKFRAFDYYRKLRLGTTEKLYKHAHPETIFGGDKEESKVFIRSELKKVNQYSITQVKGLVTLYEDLNKQGVLQSGDKKDLNELEAILFRKEKKLAHQTLNNDKPYVPRKDTIAEEVLLDLTGLNTPNLEVPRKVIDAKVDEAWAKETKKDHRNMEIKDGINRQPDEVEFNPNFPYHPDIDPEAYDYDKNE